MPHSFSIDELLEQCVALGASDLHITVGSPPVVRVRGELEALEGAEVLDGEATQTLLYRILNTEQQKRLEIDKQIDLAHDVPGIARFRVNVYFQRETLGAALRQIPQDIKSLEELGLPASLLEFTTKPRGLVLVTGPTGSGKSTTLAALIDEINRSRSDHILTIEDPVEFVHRHKRCIVNQREIGVDATGFGQALRAALRQDPDVILLGEMRDLETIATALTAAETGHLVFGTLHTQSAPSTIDRVIDVFPAEQQQQVRIAARVDAAGRRHTDFAADRRRHGPCRGARGALPRRRRAQPDSPGEGRADLLGHADQHVARHADARAVARRSDAAARDHAGRRDGRHEQARPARRAAGARRLRARREQAQRLLQRGRSNEREAVLEEGAQPHAQAQGAEAAEAREAGEAGQAPKARARRTAVTRRSSSA